MSTEIHETKNQGVVSEQAAEDRMSDRRERLAGLIGRLLAQVWLKRRRASAADSHLADDSLVVDRSRRS
ncbi:MAG: hypothetical protein U1A77_26465 [Pirellulales bacterium]